jgi:hypothetical protein
MTTKKEMINLLKVEFPTLRVGDEDNGYIELSADEYEAQILEWANIRLAKEAKQAEVEAKRAERQAILDRIGLTSDELKTILG